MLNLPSKSERLPIRVESDVVVVRQLVRRKTLELGFSLVDQTKMVTAASELGRNALIHGGGGEMECEIVSENGRKGLKIVFKDRGPGIANMEQAMQDGFTSKNGLGLGLGGAKRLVNDFQIYSAVGEGTVVSIIRWVN